MDLFKNFLKNNNAKTTDVKTVADKTDYEIKFDEEFSKEKQVMSKQKLLDKLTQVYENCDNIEDPLLVNLIEKLNIKDYTPEITKKLMSIISKRTAIDCMKFGDPRLPTLARILSPEEMFEADLPLAAFSKYKALKSEFDEDNIKYTEFTDLTKTLIRKKILEEIAKKTAETFDSSGTLIFPQTEKFKNLTDEDITLFVQTVKTYSKDFDKDTSILLTKQLKGECAVEISKSDTDAELNDALKSIELAIRQLPLQSQLPAAQAILETLNQRNEAALLLKNVKSHSSPNDNER